MRWWIGVGIVAACCLAGGLWLALRPGHQEVERARPTVVSTVAPPPHHRARPRPRRLAPAVPRRGTVTLPILMYHRIDRLDPSLPAITRRLTVPPDQFAAEMRWLRHTGHHAVTELQVYDAVVLGRPLLPR